MALGRKDTGFALIWHNSRIFSQEHFKCRLIHTEAEVLRGDIQHPVSIIGEMVQVWSSQLLPQKIALRETCQPFLGEASRRFGFSKSLADRSQFFRGSNVVWRSQQGLLQVNLCLIQIALTGREFA